MTPFANATFGMFRHVAFSSRAHPIHAALSGLHWKRSTNTKLTKTMMLRAMTNVAYRLNRRDGKNRRKKKQTDTLAVPIWILYTGAVM